MNSQSYKYNTDSISLNVKRLNSEENRRLKDSCQTIEEVQSPSTDYSDAPDTQFYETSESTIQIKKNEKPTRAQEENFEEESDEKNVQNESDESDEEEDEISLEGWNDKKDKILKNLAAKCKYDWKKIAKKFNADEEASVAPLELKQRYKELTKVAIPLRVKFGHEEDLLIAKYFNIYGCDWTQIATHFEDRTGIMLKNRYYSHIRKKNLLNSMLDELKENGEECLEVENKIEKNIEENEENEENEETEEEIIEDSTENMVEEVVDTDKPTEIFSIFDSKILEEPEEESIRFLTHTSHGISYRKIPITQFAFLEFDNCLTSVLHDKITFSRF